MGNLLKGGISKRGNLLKWGISKRRNLLKPFGRAYLVVGTEK